MKAYKSLKHFFQSGRLSDVYDASYVFIVGAASMGFLGLGAGFVRSQIPLIVLRAFMGVGEK